MGALSTSDSILWRVRSVMTKASEMLRSVPADCRQGMNLWELRIEGYRPEELSLAGHPSEITSEGILTL